MKANFKIVIGLGLTIAALLISSKAAMAQGGEPSSATSESDEATGPNIVAIGRYYGDSIVIRWGATLYPIWRSASRAGFVVERLDPSEAERGANWELLTPTPIKPLSIDEWKRIYGREDTLAGAAVQTLYGGTITTNDDPFGSIYETWIQQQSLLSYGMLLADIAPRLADGMGLRFVDKKDVSGRSYIYRVRSLANDTENPIDTAIAVVVAGEVETTPSIETLSVEEGERKVTLKWLRDEHPIPFTGYFIERSFDGGKTFSRIKNVPFVPANNTMIDDAEEGSFNTISYPIHVNRNYKPVTYRVVGVDAFGDTSPNSTEIVAMGRDRTPPPAPMIKPIELDHPNGLKISWEPGDGNLGDLDGYYIGRATNTDGPFVLISEKLSPETRSYTVHRVDTLLPSYYVVGAVDTADNLLNSVAAFGILPDSIAPTIPTGITGDIDSNGIVTLSWNPSPESDVLGYRVFFANQADHEFQQLTTGVFSDTIWRDTLTLNTLSEEIYYRITVFDQNYNHAPFSEILTLKKPDTVSPVPPVIVSVLPNERGITIGWYPSPSGDLLQQTLLRRKVGEEDWIELLTSNEPKLSLYTDSLVERTVRYEYALRATDDDGNSSALSNVITARPYDSGLRPGVQQVTATFDSTAKAITIAWQAKGSTTGQVKVYRSINDGRPGLIGSYNTELGRYVDRQIIPGATYTYRLKVVTDDGGESEMTDSNPVTLN